MTTLKEFVRLHDLAGAVTFHGWVPHDKVQDVLSQSHVLALPSIREFGGGVVLEAMAMGIVPIVVDYAGPSELVNANTGVKVPLGVRDSVVSGFRDALANAIADPAAINALSTQGRSHVHAHFTWKAKAARVLAVYRSVTSPAFRRSTMQSEPTRNRHRRSRRKARPT
jgi:glycosyltransferase involved in cell wall biosynthesis